MTTATRVSLWGCRIWMTVYAAMVVAQPTLAGQYLSGSYDSIHWHALIGIALMLAAIGCFGFALMNATVGRGPAWPVLIIPLLFVAQGIQIGTGYARSLAIHIPLGVAIVATVVALAVWVWTPAARRPGRFWRGTKATASARPAAPVGAR